MKVVVFEKKIKPIAYEEERTRYCESLLVEIGGDEDDCDILEVVLMVEFKLVGDSCEIVKLLGEGPSGESSFVARLLPFGCRIKQQPQRESGGRKDDGQDDKTSHSVGRQSVRISQPQSNGDCGGSVGGSVGRLLGEKDA